MWSVLQTSPCEGVVIIEAGMHKNEHIKTNMWFEIQLTLLLELLVEKINQHFLKHLLENSNMLWQSMQPRYCTFLQATITNKIYALKTTFFYSYYY